MLASPFASRIAFATRARSALATQSDIFDAAYKAARNGSTNANPYPVGSLSASTHQRGSTAGELAAIVGGAR